MIVQRGRSSDSSDSSDSSVAASGKGYQITEYSVQSEVAIVSFVPWYILMKWFPHFDSRIALRARP